MKKVLNTLLDKLEKQAGEVALCKATLDLAKKNSDDYYTWWQDEVTINKELKATVAELESKLEVADLAPELEPFAKAETRDEVS
tara:strand:- start:1329 stop:1580 length:252 start_codon:yes stop_codon:yes gene_type:complete